MNAPKHRPFPLTRYSFRSAGLGQDGLISPATKEQIDIRERNKHVGTQTGEPKGQISGSLSSFGQLNPAKVKRKREKNPSMRQTENPCTLYKKGAQIPKPLQINSPMKSYLKNTSQTSLWMTISSQSPDTNSNRSGFVWSW